MEDATRCATVRDRYAEVTRDSDRLWEQCTGDITFHIAGTHPLAGRYVGRRAVERYLEAVRRVPGDHAGFTITSVLADQPRELLLVEGTARHGRPAFERTVIHLLRFRDGLLAEFWDYPFDARAEDRFWTAQLAAAGSTYPRVPRQRSALERITPPLRRC